MVYQLTEKEEVECIVEASIGTSTIWVFLAALKQFCGHIVTALSEHMTYEGRYLHEVIINVPSTEEKKEKPVIIIEAGQEGGIEPVSFALYLIEQLVACKENHDMLTTVKWVILPCTNPDALEYSRWTDTTYLRRWRKNRRKIEGSANIGIDISRNFESNWGACPKVENTFSNIYPGPSPNSENETLFVKHVLDKYKKNLKAYVSLRRDGHALLYPSAHVLNVHRDALLQGAAADITHKVNQRAGTIHLFTNTSIYEFEGKPRCGHSVDYAHSLGVPLAYEMRVFLGAENHILSMFQTLPRSHSNTLTSGYYNGIKELYNIVSKDRQYDKN